MLDADRQAHVTFGDASLQLLLSGELRMSGAGRVNGERACVADVGNVIEHLQGIDKLATGPAPTLKLKAKQAAISALEIGIGATPCLTFHHARIDNLCHLRVL